MTGKLTWQPDRQTYLWEAVFQAQPTVRGRHKGRPQRGVQGRAWPPNIGNPHNWDFVGHVMPNIHCPVYDQPYPDGIKTGKVYREYECVGRLEEVVAAEDQEFLSAKQDRGWLDQSLVLQKQER